MSDMLIELFAEVLQVDPAVLNDDSSPENLKQWDSLAAMASATMTSLRDLKFHHIPLQDLLGWGTIELLERH
jgi:hypothetical protein